eukprot:TRINITY_DN73359_c0_g1_i1.p1 TRINITY_DN73359_c0_g1~~TRINITY_DN73359_c0_g1_i1.p1  ORF type:complete len:180 (-),score=11.86 TRINITY_DN73359_c0_g1_i1:120-620(-)
MADHRHNIIYKLELIPPSYRGNQLRKFLAFHFLQTCLLLNEISNPVYPTVRDIADDKYMKATYLKILMHKDDPNYSMLLVIIKLIDFVVGNEVYESFSADNLISINVLMQLLTRIRSKIPRIGAAHKTGKTILHVRLMNHIHILDERWGKGRSRDDALKKSKSGVK